MWTAIEEEESRPINLTAETMFFFFCEICVSMIHRYSPIQDNIIQTRKIMNHYEIEHVYSCNFRNTHRIFWRYRENNDNTLEADLLRDFKLVIHTH